MTNRPTLIDHRHTGMVNTILNALYTGDRVWLQDEETIVVDHTAIEFGVGSRTIRTEIKIQTWEVEDRK